MTFLTTHLGFTHSQASGSGSAQALPPAGSHLLITDTLESPGHLASYHLVSGALQAKRKIVWVDFRGEGRSSWETVLKKLGTPLPLASSPNFVHLTPTALDFPTTGAGISPLLFDGSTPSLRATYDALISALSSKPSTNTSSQTHSGGETGPLIILDGLAELLWIGFTPVAVGQFVRASLAFARRTDSILVSTLHADHLPLTPSTPSSDPSTPTADLLGRLMRLGGGGWWRFSNLSSGRSGDVHGQIASHPLYPPKPESFPLVAADHPLQYRLEAATVKVFPKGTGRGFLPSGQGGHGEGVMVNWLEFHLAPLSKPGRWAESIPGIHRLLDAET